MSFTLSRLPQTAPTHGELQIWWQQVVEKIEAQEVSQDAAIVAIQNAQAAANAANTAAAAANTAATTAQTSATSANTAATTAQTSANNAATAASATTAASNLANSYVSGFVAPMVSADSAGVVTIAAHNRVYGDGATVAVTGGTVATGQVNPKIVYIYYDQASRAGGAVTYAYTLTEGTAAQIGNRHNVGAVQIPAAGTASGGYSRPPGYGGIEP